MLPWARLALLVAGLVALAWLGWTANGWRARAAQADAYQRELRQELQRRISSDAQRLSMERDIAALQARLAREAQTAKQTVIKYVRANNPDCDLPGPVARELQRVRQGGDVPAAPDEPADPGRTSGPPRRGAGADPG